MTKQEFVSSVAENEKLLYIAAYSVVRNTEDAKDAVATAIAKAWEKLDRLKDESKFDGWILKIVYNEAKMMLRHRDDRVSLQDVKEPKYEDDLSDMRFFDILSAAKLDGFSRRIMILRFFYGYELPEIAKMTDISLPAVKARYYRALDKIKKLPGIR